MMYLKGFMTCKAFGSEIGREVNVKIRFLSSSSQNNEEIRQITVWDQALNSRASWKSDMENFLFLIVVLTETTDDWNSSQGTET